ncbi:uncharacterized protein LOC127856340 [Dreissena polymorpha]|uniref:Uncharacterized protein n=1 Tax=Dreissena polymorpha TaxID=45954 RepID=A0A9D4HJY4_DREPO|nr:uncharacterized protein LOC127856340 [Dreissena polymorpha]KAH3722045.1 hypothetical protein DPMN_064994 [Dreissena polymorpha]
MDIPVLIGSLVGTSVLVCCILIVVTCACYRNRIKKEETMFNRQEHLNHTQHAVPSPGKFGDMIRDYFREQESKESDVFHIEKIELHAENGHLSEHDIARGHKTNQSILGESDFGSEKCIRVSTTETTRGYMGRAIKCSSARSLYTSSDLAIADLTEDPLHDIYKELRDFEDSNTDSDEDTNDIIGSTNTIYTGQQSEESDEEMYPPVEERAKTPIEEVDKFYNPKQMYPSVEMPKSQLKSRDKLNNFYQMDDLSILVDSNICSDSVIDTSELSSVRFHISTHTEEALSISIEVENEINEINDTTEGELKLNDSERCTNQNVSNDTYSAEHIIIDEEKLTEQSILNAKNDNASNGEHSISEKKGNSKLLSDQDDVNQTSGVHDKLIEQNNVSPISVSCEELTEQTNINRSGSYSIFSTDNTDCTNATMCSDLDAVTDIIKKYADQKKSNTVADNEKQPENTILTNGYLKSFTRKEKNYDTIDKKDIQKKPVKRRKGKIPQASNALKISDYTRPSIPINSPIHSKVQRGHAFLERLYLEEKFRQKPEAVQSNTDLARKRKRGDSIVKKSKSLSQPVVLPHGTSPSTQSGDIQLKSSLSSAKKVNKKRSISFKSPEPTPDSWMRGLMDTSGEHKKTRVINTPSTACNNVEPVSLSHILFYGELL